MSDECLCGAPHAKSCYHERASGNAPFPRLEKNARGICGWFSGCFIRALKSRGGCFGVLPQPRDHNWRPLLDRGSLHCAGACGRPLAVGAQRVAAPAGNREAQSTSVEHQHRRFYVRQRLIFEP